MSEEKERAVRVERVTLDDGREGWLYSDGSVRNDSGHYMVRDERGADLITSANARQLRARRARIMAEATMQGLAQAAKSGKSLQAVPGSAEAWQLAAEELGNIIFSKDDKVKPRDKIEAHRALALAGDALPARVPDAGEDSHQPTAQETQFLRMLYARARMMNDEKKSP